MHDQRWYEDNRPKNRNQQHEELTDALLRLLSENEALRKENAQLREMVLYLKQNPRRSDIEESIANGWTYG